jgi:predicted O-linked N-acetylglucosamine transferase (SPINDLY family)
VIGKILISAKINLSLVFTLMKLMFYPSVYFIFDDPRIHQRCAQTFIHRYFPANRYPRSSFPKSTKQRLRIAYISPDFGNHPVSFLGAELFELHDRAQFEIYAVSFSKA